MRVYTTDDLCPENLKYFKFWDEIKLKYPNIRLIAFTIANYKYEQDISKSAEFKDWYEQRKDWVEIGVHGYDHLFPPEQERENSKECVDKSLHILNSFLPKRILYRPPGHQRTVRTEIALRELGVSGIAYQDRIRYFDTGEIIENIFNTHCCNKYHNPITRWKEYENVFGI